MSHIIERYSYNTVKTWYFEVWNESDIRDFWTGTFDEYMKLYEITSSEIKSFGADLKVGGPALSSFHNGKPFEYLSRFLESCAKKKLAVDFVSGHPYPFRYAGWGSKAGDVFLPRLETSRDIAAFAAVVKRSPYPNAELHFDEWNSSANDRDLVHDTAFMAVFVIDNYLSCRGASSLCWWSASDRFEEHGFPAREFHGGFGLLSISGLRKPQFWAFRALALLLDIEVGSGEDFIVTKDGDEKEFAVLAWNYVHYTQDYANGGNRGGDLPDYYDRYQVFENSSAKYFHITLEGLNPGDYILEKTVFDRRNGSVFDFWLDNGAFERLSQREIELFTAQCIPRSTLEICRVDDDGVLSIEQSVEPFGFAFWYIRRQ